MLKFLLALCYFAVTLIIGYMIGYESRQFHFLLFLTINQFFLSFILYLRSNISGLQLFKTDSLLSVLDRVLMIVICSVLIWGNVTALPFRIEWFIYAQTAAYIVTFIICLFVVIYKAGYKKPKWNYPFFLLILKQSFPFALLILLMTFYNRIDAVMLERMLPDGNKQAGVYAAAYRILDAFNMVAYLFAVILLPLFSRMLKLRENIFPIIKISYSLLFVFSVYVALFSVFNGKEIISLLYHSHISESAAVFHILMFCIIPVSTTYIFGTLLTANGSLKVLNMIAFSGMILNIGLNLLFIPQYKTMGAASVSLLTQSLTALLQLLYVVSLFRMRIDVNYLLRLLVQAGIMLTAMYFAGRQFDNLLWILLFTGSISVLSAVLLRILKPFKFLRLLMEKKD
jgi:O-antigen/teichoic acid export membrane protein